jgi:4-amino-4-deoxy-L-arabinose transferase-like glycosyltransferase
LALRPGLGIPATIIVVAPWFVAIALKSDGAFFATAVSEDLLGKVSTGQQNHWGPPGFYFVAFFLTFWPAAALAAMALPFVWSRRRDDGVAFLIAWVAPSWLLFEAFSTKLPHYVLPLYPAIAIATAMAISRGAVGPHRKGATGVALLIPGIPIALTVGLVSGTWALDRTLPVAALPVLLAACVLSVLAWWAFSRAEVMRSAFTSLAAAILLALGVLGIAQLNLPALKISPRLADIARSAPCQAPEVGTLGYREPSLVFLVGTDLEMFPNAQAAAEFTGRGGCRVTFVERRHEADYKAALAARNLTPELAARVPGFNINSGRRTEVAAYLTRPLAP